MTFFLCIFCFVSLYLQYWWYWTSSQFCHITYIDCISFFARLTMEGHFLILMGTFLAWTSLGTLKEPFSCQQGWFFIGWPCKGWNIFVCVQIFLRQSGMWLYISSLLVHCLSISPTLSPSHMYIHEVNCFVYQTAYVAFYGLCNNLNCRELSFCSLLSICDSSAVFNVYKDLISCCEFGMCFPVLD